MAYPRVARKPSATDQLDLVSLAAVAAALRLRSGAVRSIGDTTRTLGVIPRHEWLVRRWLGALARCGVVELDGDTYRVRGEVPGTGAEDLDVLHVQSRIPEEVARLHGRALRHLPELLRDEVTAAELLAPESTVHGALAGEGLSLFTQQLDEGCADLVALAAGTRRHRTRVVELGCGTGRLTTAVLRESPDLTEHYRFTDIGYQPLRSETLDVDEDFVAQGFADATADIVLAGHTLHHAANIGQTLARIRNLLAPGGELLFTTPAEDDPVSLTSTHFLHSRQRLAAAFRDGVIFPAMVVWRNALYAAGFTVKVEFSVGARTSVRHHLFHAVRENV
ncbi:class I SAM-dependent methyltransferase [Lentzea aerocolonigenes]|uniref:class I SAM-dependent methyltransferase n=1 Tax=Lentzea aerocolonigenes TaxID=68170 RepID=UPI0018C8A6BF|nr:class I SAM-dependent methyltransferase [Lentzea aerocolonigenes]